MLLGKNLRLRRLFSHGRTLIGLVDSSAISNTGDGPASATRGFARCGMDAIAISPGLLERVADDLRSLALVLRLNLRSARAHPLVSIQGALELGAEAVLLTVAAASAPDLELLGRFAEEARRCGMPVIVEMMGEDLPEITSVAVEFGADVIQLGAQAGDAAQLRAAVRLAGRPVLVRLEVGTGEAQIRSLGSILETGIQGVMVEPAPDRSLLAINGLVHQGASLEEALGVIAGTI